jgi:arginase family enzyme
MWSTFSVELYSQFGSGADIVEVAPAYDHGEEYSVHSKHSYSSFILAEITATAAADLVHDFLSLMTVKKTS